MKGKLFSGIAAMMMLLVLVSCGKVPQAQIDAANAAIESAKAAQADIYVSAEFGQLQDSLNAVMADVEAEKSKFFKSYQDATVKLEAVVATATEVGQKAAVRKEEVKVEGEALLAALTTMIAENKDLIARAPKGKEGAAVLEEIKAEMTVIEGVVAEATALHTNGEYMAALDKFKAAGENATAINTELKEAIAKVRR
jgi:hypothetical protein